MTDKSHVGLQVAICPVCTKEHDVGILLDRRLKKTLDHKNITHFEMCPDCNDKKKEGYIAFVGIDLDKSEKLPNGNIKPEGAYRLGAYAHIRKSVCDELFNVPITTDMVFVDQQMLDEFEKMMPKEAE